MPQTLPSRDLQRTSTLDSSSNPQSFEAPEPTTRCLNCASVTHQHLFTRDGYHLVKCSECSLAYISNPPTAQALQEYYSFKSNYHQNFKTSEVSRQQFLKRGQTYYQYLSKFRQTGRLLDVGCSAGFFLKVAADQGWEVRGLEFSPDSAGLGQELYGIDIQVGDLTSNSLAKSQFDAITLWDVIEHLPDPLSAMQNAFELMAPGGLLAISTPNIDGLFPRLSYLPAKALNHWTHAEPPAHLTQFSIKTLGKLLSRAGFQIVSYSTRSIPLSYSFGELKDIIRMPKYLAYAAVFAPVAVLGQAIGMGDEVVMIAQKQS